MLGSESEGFGVWSLLCPCYILGQSKDILALELDIHFMSDDSRKMDDSDEDFDGEQQC